MNFCAALKILIFVCCPYLYTSYYGLPIHWIFSIGIMLDAFVIDNIDEW